MLRRLTHSLSAGGYDFEKDLLGSSPDTVNWIPKVLAGVVVLTAMTEELINPGVGLALQDFDSLAQTATDLFFAVSDARIRIHISEATAPFAVLLPLDRLFDIRAAVALRFWRALTGRRPGADVTQLTPERRSRLIMALRALDARLLGTKYPDIAAGLFDTGPISKRDWISHELRDQTGRLVRLGFKMMNGGYRQLLLYPYRRHI